MVQFEDRRRAQSGTGCTKDVVEASAMSGPACLAQAPSAVEAG